MQKVNFMAKERRLDVDELSRKEKSTPFLASKIHEFLKEEDLGESTVFREELFKVEIGGRYEPRPTVNQLLIVDSLINGNNNPILSSSVKRKLCMKSSSIRSDVMYPLCKTNDGLKVKKTRYPTSNDYKLIEAVGYFPDKESLSSLSPRYAKVFLGTKFSSPELTRLSKTIGHTGFLKILNEYLKRRAISVGDLDDARHREGLLEHTSIYAKNCLRAYKV